MSVTLPKWQEKPVFGENGKIDTYKLKNKLQENQRKQSKLTDAYLDNLFGEDVFRCKIEELRKEEDRFKKILVGYELMEMERERSEGYIDRVKDFLEGYDDSLTKVSFEQKRQMAGLLFKNIKISPAIGGSRPQKRISFSLFAPFNFLFSETEKKLQCQKNQKLTKIRRKKSTSEHSADQWEHSNRTILSFLHTIYDEIFVSNEAYLRWVTK